MNFIIKNITKQSDCLVNKRFGILTVLKFNDYKSNRKKWLCLCDCGNKKIVENKKLINNIITSCGCLKSKHKHHVYHNKSKTIEYSTWINIKNRCNNINNKDYGGRGITVCDRWLNSFENFLEDMGKRPVNTSIDRINNNLGYYKENCRWATKEEQHYNKRNTVIITYKNETKPLIEFCKELGLKYETINHRIKVLKWSISNALNIPIDRKL